MRGDAKASLALSRERSVVDEPEAECNTGPVNVASGRDSRFWCATRFDHNQPVDAVKCNNCRASKTTANASAKMTSPVLRDDPKRCETFGSLASTTRRRRGGWKAVSGLISARFKTGRADPLGDLVRSQSSNQRPTLADVRSRTFFNNLDAVVTSSEQLRCSFWQNRPRDSAPTTFDVAVANFG